METYDLSKFGGGGGSSDATNSSAPADTYDLSQFGGGGGKTPVNSGSQSNSGTKYDLSQFGVSGSSSDSPSGWNGILDNPITHGIGNVLGAIGGGIDKVEQFTGLNKVSGAARNLINTAGQLNNPNIDNMTPAEREQSRPRGGELWNSIVQGFNNPDQANQNLQQGLQTSADAGNWSPLQKGATDFVVNTGTDPLSYVPIGAIGKGVAKASDVLGATPYLAKAADAVANTPGIKQAIGGTQDVFGKMFTRNYGANPDLVNILDESAGSKSVNQQSILNSLSELSQGHGLTPDELNQIGHVIEGTMEGTPAQQAFAQKWNDLAYHGPGGKPETPISPESAPVSEIPKEPTNLDDLVQSKGFSDVTPETIAQTYNGKTWYHGTGTDKLTAETLDPFVGSHESLFGQGVYLTDDPKIAQGYASKRGARSGTPTVNDLNVNVNKVLDIEKPITPDVQSVIDDTVKPLDYQYNRHFEEPDHFTNLMKEEMSKPGATPETVITALRKEVRDFSHEAEIPTSEFTDNFQDLAINLKKSGYDALTHTGGGRTGNDPHRVMIMLDPQNWHGATEGQGSQVTRMGKYEHPIEPAPPEPTVTAPSSEKQLPNNGNPIGTSAMLHTASAVNGEPLLQGTIPNWFKHMYDNVPDELKGVFPKHEYGSSGLSTTGSFNLPRTFPTLQDAQAARLNPVLDPFHVLGEHLNQSSNALTNNSVIQQVKDTPGLLFPKDPIDEVAKLVKTGRMTADQAAQSLGMSLDDLKTGFVQSKVPQLSGAYIRPADEAALMEHLNPTMPTGPFAAIGKLNNLYNKGFLINPLPHMHNIYTNGVGLGGADTGYIKQTMDALKNGQIDPWHARATQAGAINNAVGGKFSDAIDRAVAPEGNVFSNTGNAIKDSFSSLPTSGKDLLDKIKAPFQPALNAGHDLLWNNDAAIRTSLFRGAVESGASDAEAAAHANKFMVDYNNMTPFEKQYVKPLINFYAWKKGNIPLQASQMIAQTPKYVAYDHAKDAISQAVSGQPTDKKGRINTNEHLPDGSSTVVDPYSPMDEVGKIADHGIPTFLYNSLNPGVKEAITQGTSMAQAAGLPIQNKFPIYNPAAPAGYNVRSGVAHIINAMNPLNSSAVLGQAGSQSNLINHIFGMPTNNKPDQTTIDFITKMMGGFTSRDNPATDAKKQYYQQKDNAVNFKKYMKDVSKTK